MTDDARRLLDSRKHKVFNRAHWMRERKPCARCGKAIDYDGPRYLADGRPNPDYLCVGHKIGRADGIRLGMSPAELNDLTNSQPECYSCSVGSAGGAPGLRGTPARASEVSYRNPNLIGLPKYSPFPPPPGTPPGTPEPPWGWGAPEGRHV
jgi:hypothetical protein